MASAKTSLANTQEKTGIVSEQERPSFLQHFTNLIQRRAYDLFERDGCADGNDLTHWLQAEDELVMHPAVHEAAGWFTLKVPVPATSEDRVKVFCEEDRAIISADSTREKTFKDGMERKSESAYYSVRWPEYVDPNTATAQFFKDGMLTLTARKAESGERAASSAPAEGNEKAKSAAAGAGGTTGAAGMSSKS
jgi:HSP20 family molecular chaperone IbpA